MDGYGYITTRQVLWAKRHKIPLDLKMRPQGDYVKDYRKNLFKELSPQAAGDFRQGAGKELEGKMRALHSSSALVANLFHYLHRTGNLSLAARALGIRQGAYYCLSFEAQCRVRGVRGKPPHLDAILTGNNVAQPLAIEGKFREPYQGKHPNKLSPTYLKLANGIWEGWPALKNAAKEMYRGQGGCIHLHAKQLITHLLGLRTRFGRTGFRLIYLWYDVPFDEGAAHRKEIEEFQASTKLDKIQFEHITYQEVIATLAKERANHCDYVDWLTERYL